MLNRKTLTALALIATGITGPVLADDGDVQYARILLEEARTFGVSQPIGQAAGEVDAQRARRQDAAKEQLNDNEKLWEATSKSSGN